MFLGAPTSLGAPCVLVWNHLFLISVSPPCAWCMGTLNIWGMKIQSVKAQKDMCGKIYIERISFLFWVNFTDYNIVQLLSQNKTKPLPRNAQCYLAQFYFAKLFENKGIDTLQQVIRLMSLPTSLVTQLLLLPLYIQKWIARNSLNFKNLSTNGWGKIIWSIQKLPTFSNYQWLKKKPQ